MYTDSGFGHVVVHYKQHYPHTNSVYGNSEIEKSESQPCCSPQNHIIMCKTWLHTELQSLNCYDTSMWGNKSEICIYSPHCGMVKVPRTTTVTSSLTADKW